MTHDCYNEGMNKTEKKRLVLFDAHALIHRAYHALPDMTTRQGEPTGGLYGLTSMLLRAISDYKPDYAAACFDLPGPTFRHIEYKDYKGTRSKADEELKAQLQRSRDIFKALSISIFDAKGFEADDILGTIVEQMKDDSNLEIIIVTGDADSLQLVIGEKVRVFTLRKGLTDVVVYDEEKVKDRYGFTPIHLPDYKGLCGDTSDNIPGVKGIGEKTASDLISKFGTLENIYENIEKDESALLKEGIKPRIISLLKEGKEDAIFSKMLATIRKDAPIEYKIPDFDWKSSVTIDEATRLFNELEFKTMAKRLEVVISEVTGVMQEKKEIINDDSLDKEKFRKAQIAFWLLDAEKGKANFETISSTLNVKTLDEAMDVLEKELKKKEMIDLYENIELPLIPIIEKIQNKGMLLDKEHLYKLSKEYHRNLEKIRSTIYTLAGEEFNINSPKQLGVILFEKLALNTKGLKKTASGASKSTKESELDKLKGSHPIIENILEYRELQKVLTTYIDVLPSLTDDRDRIHTKLHQDGTVTGRFSSSDPNLQNIPVRDGYGELIRDAFIAPSGKTLVAFDYSQIELRVLAMLSKDRNLRDIFEGGQDIHAGVASRVFGVPEDKVTDIQRRRAKTINFGILYGMGVSSLAQTLEVSRGEAQKFHDQYFEAFPTIRNYLESVLIDANKNGYTTTLFGRQRQFSNLRSKVPFIKAMAERMAMNAPLQGTAADLMKKAMIDVDKAITDNNLEGDVDMILQVHDELIFEVTNKEEILKKLEKIVRKAMSEVNKGTVGENIPLQVSCSIGKRWGSMNKI